MKKSKQPQPVRDEVHPTGFPEVLRQGGGLAKKVEDDTAMAVLAATQAALAVVTGRFFIIENPTDSLIWHLDEMKALAGLPGVKRVDLHNCAFGGLRRKATTFLTNLPELEEECGKLCSESRAEANCPHLGVPHLPWAPKVDGMGCFDPPSKEEADYPVALCEAIARACVRRRAGVMAKGGRFTLPTSLFIEVFSGINAPLTAAVAAAVKAVPRDL